MFNNVSYVATTDMPVSPVTLNDHWSRLARLLLLASMATVGSILNVFMISAVMIEDYLRRRGNTFVVNIAMADLLVTGLVIPASAVVILAGLKDNLTVCRFQWFVAVWCFLVTVLSLAAVAVENHLRLCYSTNTYNCLTQKKITFILLTFWIASGTISGLQFYPDLSFDYCTRKYPGLLTYQATISAIMVVLPINIAFLCYFRTAFRVRHYKSRQNFKAHITFNWDCSLMYTNIYSLLLFLLFWLPFGIALALTYARRVPDSLFYNLAWLGISKSCVNSVLYCIFNQHFRSAYINLFHYCCCKTTVSFSRRQRPECVRPSGDVRVHIIPGYNMYCSPQRSGREGQNKRCLMRGNGREVYEL